MPSKRKKNKRRMRRVQAQRRALEEQHVANPPVKASPGIAVSTPPEATPRKAAKTPAPELAKIPEVISNVVPTAVPTVEIPKVEPKPYVKEAVAEPVPVELVASEPEHVVLEQTPAEAEVEALALVTEEASAIETPPVAPCLVEASVLQEVEPIIPVTGVTPPAEAPAAPAESEVLTVDTTIITTETEQMHHVCKAETEVEAETLAEEGPEVEVEAEVCVKEDTFIAEPVTAATEELVVEALNTDPVSAEAEPAADTLVTETAVGSAETEIREPEQATEAAVSPAAAAEEEANEAEAKALADEDAPEVPAKPITAAEDAPAQSVETRVVSDSTSETPAENPEPLISEDKEAPSTQHVAETSAEDSEESVSAVKEIVITSDTQTESVDVTPAAELEPPAAPAEDMLTISDARESCLDVMSQEPKAEICDTLHQVAVESVQLSSVVQETAVETAVNGHIVPEVSTEG